MTRKISASLNELSASESTSESDNGISFGIGADFGVSNDVALVIEYIKYMSKSDFDISAIEVGFNIAF